MVQNKKDPLADYDSPRWSNEFLDCSMPMTLDTYNLCHYQCQYCFSFYQRIHTTDYANKKTRYVDVEKVKRIFNDPDSSQFGEIIKQRKPIQWGGLSEPFDLVDSKLGISLELLRFFREINYPVSFSTKSTWFVKDDRYRDLIKGATNFHFKFSIITLDEEKYRKVEVGVPSPMERLEAMRQVYELGVGGVTLRLRPFIIGISNPTHLQLIEEASKRGAFSMSTEFFCLEGRADGRVKDRYKVLSEACGYDLWDFYKIHSYQSGYKRLNYALKRPFIKEMENKCKELGMEFFCSDANHKERCARGNCCGLPDKEPFKNYNHCQFTQAIVLAKEKGGVKFSDIYGDGEFLKKMQYVKANGLNTASTANRVKHWSQSLYDYMRWAWNTPSSGNSPYRYFDKMLIPDGVDENGDVIYKFNKEKYEK